ncbi:chemotaxis protein CheB [Saccharothrix xinjiangensis]|uniref:protein-glutamate methylesterase n=1 Tax=Saccharothrix xinjiangensis TaxID=204798 RepID=A0ABV9Y3W5_9PSEU
MAEAHRDLIVVGASAGGVEALRTLVAGLPAELPATVAVVLHMPAGGASALPAILDRSGPLPAVFARSGMPLTPGQVCVAPPDHHLLVVEDRFALSHGPTENGHRPAVDALFRSAAIAGGPRVTCVVLSGVLDDGVAGAVAVRARGGLVVVQSPADALHPGMPENVLRHVRADRVLPAAELGAALAELARERVAPSSAPPTPPQVEQEDRIVRDWRGIVGDTHMIGEASGYTCPDCNGVLNEVHPGTLRFRCQIGHAWSVEALAQAQGDAFEKALWTALRTLEEKVRLSERMLENARARGDGRQAARYQGRLEESVRAVDVLRGFLLARGEPVPEEGVASGDQLG